MTTDTLPPILTVPELAALLRVSLPTAYSAVKRGEVPGVVRVGRTVRISRQAVLSWLGAQGCVPLHGGKPCQ
jgi:excisionase family DNA binding protein